jgi:hypothetical protein
MPGFRQRWGLAVAEEAPAPLWPGPEQSSLITRLLLQYTCGTISAAEVCRLAHAAVVDGCEHPEVFKFAALCSWGEYPANAKRDIEKLIDVRNFPVPKIIRVPCLDTKSNPHLVMHDDMGIMEPHMWIDAISKLPEAETMLGLETVETFWNNVSPHDPRLLANGGHPMLQVPNYKRKFVPLWLHGDGVEYSENDTIQVFTCGCVTANTNSMLAMFYIACFVKSVTAILAKHGADTWNEAWVFIVYSLHALWLGIHLAFDPMGVPWPAGSKERALAGTPICNGFRFVLWNLTGDLEYFANTLGMSHWRSHDLCWQCSASKIDQARTWKINWPGKGWQLHDPTLFHMISRRNHPVFRVDGVTSWMICWDTLHVTDNKGVGSHCMGSILHEMVYVATPGNVPSEKLALIWRRVQQIYDANSVSSRLTSLHLSMITNPDKPLADYPSLHAKAADCRHLVPVMAQVALENHDGSEPSYHRVQALRHLANFHQKCDEQPMFMSTAAADAILVDMEGFLSHYTWLHWKSEAAGKWLYNLVPKAHYAWHLAYCCRFMNARFTWTYKAESWIGMISRMAASCAHGTRLTKKSVPLGSKYRMFAHVRVSRSVFDD